jgi:NAD kinase
MALPSSSVLKARAESGYGNLLLTIDGQEAIEIGETDEVLFRASGHKINLITHPEKNFYTILREKLSWGK